LFLIQTANAIAVCGSSPAAATCEGDSGSGLVRTGSNVLLAVVSGGDCAAGTPIVATYVGAPGILRLIQVDHPPPIAPRSTGVFPNLSGPVGSTLTCSLGEWTGNPKLTYSFVDSKTGIVLQAGTRTTFKVTAQEPADSVSCRVIATNAGGTVVVP